MATRGKILLLFCFLLVSAASVLGKQEAELRLVDNVVNPRKSPWEKLGECESQCEEQSRQGQQEQEHYMECQQKCFDEFKREEQEGQGSRDNPREDPEKAKRECEDRCREKYQRRDQRERCEWKCRRKREERDPQYLEDEGGHDNPREDPEKAKRECEDRCREKYQRRDQRERCEWKCWQKREEERDPHYLEDQGGHDNPREDPEKAKTECQDRCREKYQRRDQRERCEWKCWRGEGDTHYQEREECEDFCRERYWRKDQRERCQRQCQFVVGDTHYHGREYEQEQSPYVFQDEHFTSQLKTEHGTVKILQKFTQKSELLRGIENFRVAMLEADPQTFVVPNHVDADVIIFVTQGRGTLSLVRPEKRESFNVKRGDIVRIPAGITAYIINRDNNQRLVLAKLLRPVSTPGNFEAFYGPGGDNPESFYKVFSTEILEAAFNTRRDKLQRIFGQQKKGVIIKASEEQIRALNRQEEGGSCPVGGESKVPYNLLEKRPQSSNQYGSLHTVDADELKQLEDLNMAVCYMNITQGSMAGPRYYSKSTEIAVVLNGEGYFEMACPHLSSQESGKMGSKGTKSYEKVRSHLRRGVVFVIPAGHPIAIMASNNQNLEIMGFQVNAKNNENIPLVGKMNVINQMEREAMELAFGVSAGQVDEVFGRQEEEMFFKGPRQQRRTEM